MKKRFSIKQTHKILDIIDNRVSQLIKNKEAKNIIIKILRFKATVENRINRFNKLVQRKINSVLHNQFLNGYENAYNALIAKIKQSYDYYFTNIKYLFNDEK